MSSESSTPERIRTAVTALSGHSDGDAQWWPTRECAVTCQNSAVSSQRIALRDGQSPDVCARTVREWTATDRRGEPAAGGLPMVRRSREGPGRRHRHPRVSPRTARVEALRGSADPRTTVAAVRASLFETPPTGRRWRPAAATTHPLHTRTNADAHHRDHRPRRKQVILRRHREPPARVVGACSSAVPSIMRCRVCHNRAASGVFMVRHDRRQEQTWQAARGSRRQRSPVSRGRW